MDETKPARTGRKSFTKTFKQEAVARLKETDNATALALELGVRRNLLYKWAEALDKAGPEKAF
jgi:transposase